MRKTVTTTGKSRDSGKKSEMLIAASDQTMDARNRIDARITELGDWRGETLARVRMLIKRSRVVEEWKWGVPVWASADGRGIICTGEAYKSVVKLTFAKGASLADPSGLFNSSLAGNARRAIDLHEGDRINVKAFKALIDAAVIMNSSGRSESRGKPSRRSTSGRSRARPTGD